MARRGRNLLIKILVGVAVAAGLAFLFIRSAYQTRSQPYTVERRHLANWTLSTEKASDGAILSLRPPPELGPTLFREIFSRMMESLTAPTPVSMPLLLQSEYDKAFAGRMTPEALTILARFARFESAVFEPQCLASRRISEPGSTRQVYFILFNAPVVESFRQGLQTMVTKAGAGATDFDASALSPVVIVAATDAGFSRWLPLRADAKADCVAPIVVN